MQPQRLTDAARYTLVVWSRMFDWKNALVVVKPDTLIGWHRKGFRLFWRWKSRPGRPTLHPEIRALILRMAGELSDEILAVLRKTDFFNISNDVGRVKGLGLLVFVISHTRFPTAHTHCSLSRT
jgi:hypothetical protein